MVVGVTDKDVSSDVHLFELYGRWLAAHRPDVIDSGNGNWDRGNDNVLLKRFHVFKNNARYIHESNKRTNVTYTLGLNKFADLSNEEFRAMYTQLPQRVLQQQGGGRSAGFIYGNVSEPLPALVDWRKKGAVTSIKDQGACGMWLTFNIPFLKQRFTDFRTIDNGIYCRKSGTALAKLSMVIHRE